jgi:Ca-activated chloride channel family protein
VYWSLRSRQHGAARFSALQVVRGLPPGWALLGPLVLVLLRSAVLVLLITALARPQTAKAWVPAHSDGIAIQLVIDNSYSMRNRDYQQGGASIARLDAVKHTVKLFVAGGDHGLKGRPADKIGIITFARDPDVVCPLTLDHEALLEAVDHIRLAPPVGTNIGDALAWALDRLRHDPTKQKVVILLSDGSHNVKEGLPPLEAAQIAADLKIKVYTIGAVGNQLKLPGSADVFRRKPGVKYLGDSVDEPMMDNIAVRTGGQYFRATDTNGLMAIYREIDHLETTRMETTTHVSYQEWFLAALFPGAGLLVLAQGLAATRFLRIP